MLHDNFRDDFLSASYFAPRRALHITLHAMCDVLSEKTLIFYSTVCAEHCMSLRCDCQCIMLLTETNEMLLVCWLAFDYGNGNDNDDPANFLLNFNSTIQMNHSNRSCTSGSLMLVPIKWLRWMCFF